MGRSLYVGIVLAFLACARNVSAAEEPIGTLGPSGAAGGAERSGTIEPRVGLAVATGVALAMAPLAAGGAMFAGSDQVGRRQEALWVALTGLTVAPVVGHLIAREWKRAGIFGAAPLAGSALTLALVYAYPELLDHGTAPVRVSFGFGLSLAVVGAVVGLADLPGASDRWKRKRPPAVPVALAPLVLGSSGGGLALGGRF